MEYEVAIVGGAVAGASAALILARCMRRVLVCDDGHPRNALARAVHGFITRDGMPPAEFLRVAREQVLAYPTVSWRSVHVDSARRISGGFELALADRSKVTAEKVLLATGLVDELPEIEGLDRFWGHSVFICPLCDAWSVRGQRMVVIGRGPNTYMFALEVLQWADGIVICTNGPSELAEVQRHHLGRSGAALMEQPIAGLEGSDGQVERIRFADGTGLETRVIFLTVRQHQRSQLADELGCARLADDTIATRTPDCAAAPGVWVAGNASEGLQMAVIAAAEGVQAAHTINEQLVKERYL